jgi:hypothetical protein
MWGTGHSETAYGEAGVWEVLARQTNADGSSSYRSQPWSVGSVGG